MYLQINDGDLRDLAVKNPALVDAQSGRPTGLTLLRCLGVGGMSSVFLAALDLASRAPILSSRCPSRIAIKITKPSTKQQLSRIGLDPLAIYVREAAALGRVMARNPPTEFIVQYFGSGTVAVSLQGDLHILPWLAIEWIDGGDEGVTLTQRIQKIAGGVDPIRALHLATGILEGARILHEEGILHRDFKPDNLLLSGPVGLEIPKLADCGIARVDGLDGGTIAAMTPSYGGPEQMLSALRPGERNPLVGPWSDVHALSAVIWFLLAGEDWCRGELDSAWHNGQRRSLLTTHHRIHPVFSSNTEPLARLDRVLQRGASHRLPEFVWNFHSADQYEPLAKLRFNHSMFSGVPRYESVQEMARDLLPILEEFQDIERGIESRKTRIPHRSTQLLPVTREERIETGFHYREIAPGTLHKSSISMADLPAITPGGVVFQPGGRLLVRAGDRLVYLISEVPHPVAVPPPWRGLIAASRWLTRGPGGSGFLLAGPRHLLQIRGGHFQAMRLPTIVASTDTKEVVSLTSSGDHISLVIAGTLRHEWLLWRSQDGEQWTSPKEVSFHGALLSAAEGEQGLLLVGRSPSGGASVWREGQGEIASSVLAGAPQLTTVLWRGQDAWVAGQGRVFRVDGPSLIEEASEMEMSPVTAALDPSGIPWLLTHQEILRRDSDPRRPLWRQVYRRTAEHPPWVGIGFSIHGVRVLDSRGGGILMEPPDIQSWRACADTSLLLD